MSQPNPKTTEQKTTEQKTTEQKAMTKADAAKLVMRGVAKMKDGKPVVDPQTKQAAVELVPIGENEVMAFADYGDHVIVVTTSGEKLRGDKGGK